MNSTTLYQILSTLQLQRQYRENGFFLKISNFISIFTGNLSMFISMEPDDGTTDLGVKTVIP